MQYTIESDVLRVSADTLGAELQSIWHKPTGAELLWQGDAAVWGRRAPLMFPHCGNVWQSTLHIRGTQYPSQRHGFAREMQFAGAQTGAASMEFVLAASEETRVRFPYEFALVVRYRVEGAKLVQSVRVENTAPKACAGVPAQDMDLPFNIGFHPAFAIPFEEGGAAGDYEFVFDTPQSPLVVDAAGGYDTGARRRYFEEETAIPLRDDLFENDSICFGALTARSMTLRKRSDHSQYVRVDIEHFPYTLIWGPPRGPLPFVCIEPWHGLPDPVGYEGEFADKPGVQKLAPGESFTTDLCMEFGR